MALTRSFKETVLERIRESAGFRKELLREGIECLLSGDVETGKDLLRDYINGTIGFTTLGQKTQCSPKSLMRMFGPKGNPNARNLMKVIAHLQKAEGVKFQLRFAKDAA